MNRRFFDTLCVIDKHWAERGYSISIRELQEARSLSSTSVTNYHIRKLQAEEHIAYATNETGKMLSRTITITEKGRKALDEAPTRSSGEH